MILYIKQGNLIDKGKIFFEDNFIVYLDNSISLETHTHHLPKHI